MNWDQIEGKWNGFTGSARERWVKLTDNDWEFIPILILVDVEGILPHRDLRRGQHSAKRGGRIAAFRIREPCVAEE